MHIQNFRNWIEVSYVKKILRKNIIIFELNQGTGPYKIPCNNYVEYSHSQIKLQIKNGNDFVLYGMGNHWIIIFN